MVLERELIVLRTKCIGQSSEVPLQLLNLGEFDASLAIFLHGFRRNAIYLLSICGDLLASQLLNLNLLDRRYQLFLFAVLVDQIAVHGCCFSVLSGNLQHGNVVGSWCDRLRVIGDDVFVLSLCFVCLSKLLEDSRQQELSGYVFVVDRDGGGQVTCSFIESARIGL